MRSGNAGNDICRDYNGVREEHVDTAAIWRVGMQPEGLGEEKPTWMRKWWEEEDEMMPTTSSPLRSWTYFTH